MFPEIYDEFGQGIYPAEFTKMMEPVREDDTSPYEYELDLELPYGAFET
jgi:hypothetical protein